MPQIVSFFSGDLLKTLSARSVKINKNGSNARVTIVLDIIDPAYMGSDGGYSAKGDEIVMSMDSANLSLLDPEISFNSQDETNVYVNVSWKVDGKKVNHGQSYITAEK